MRGPKLGPETKGTEVPAEVFIWPGELPRGARTSEPLSNDPLGKVKGFSN